MELQIGTGISLYRFQATSNLISVSVSGLRNPSFKGDISRWPEPQIDVISVTPVEKWGDTETVEQIIFVSVYSGIETLCIKKADSGSHGKGASHRPIKDILKN